MSRFNRLSRLMGMNRNQRSTWIWMAVIVLLHFLVTVVHGTAHARANVPLSAAGNAFVLAVIVVGPWIGLGLMLWSERIGAWVIALTMAASLVFGFVNHFVLDSPDHVAHVAAQWRQLFAFTAVLLVLTEALGSGLALHTLRGRRLR